MSKAEKEKLNKQITAYFKDKSALVLELTGMYRTCIKKSLLEMGIPSGKVLTPETFQDAAKVIASEKPNVVVVRQLAKQFSGQDLLDIHLKNCPNRIDASFFYISEENSPSNTCILLETEVDGIFVTPFTIDSIKSTITTSIQKKLTPSPYTRAVEEGKAMLFMGDKDSALKRFQQAVDLNKTPVLANYYLSAFLVEEGKLEEAENILKNNIDSNPKHYRSLSLLSDLFDGQSRFTEQYDVEGKILENYPLNPEKIPRLTKLSIINGHYEDIFNYTRVFGMIKNASDQIQMYIAAGLATCARFLIDSGKIEEGENAVHQAAKLSGGRIKILLNLAQTYLKMNKKTEALKLFGDNIKDTGDDSELKLAQFEIESFGSNPADVFINARKLFQHGLKSPRLFEVVFECYRKSGLKDDGHQKAKEEAEKLFPDHPFKF